MCLLSILFAFDITIYEKRGIKMLCSKAVEILAKINKVYSLYTSKCDAFGSSLFPLLSIMKCYKPKDDKSSIFHTHHYTVRVWFLHRLVTW